jgi:hypothetical protein
MGFNSAFKGIKHYISLGHLENQGIEASIILKWIISEISTETSYRLYSQQTESMQWQKILMRGHWLNPVQDRNK